MTSRVSIDFLPASSHLSGANSRLPGFVSFTFVVAICLFEACAGSHCHAGSGDLIQTYISPYPGGGLYTAAISLDERLLLFDIGARRGYEYDAATGVLLSAFRGSSVAEDGDGFGTDAIRIGNAIFASAPNTGFTPQEGSVFHFDASTLDETLISPSETLQRFRFGNALEALGDRLVVGAPESSPPAKVVVIDPATGGVDLIIPRPASATDRWFGTSLAVADRTIFVGGARRGLGGTHAEAIYAFDGDTGELQFTIPNPAPGDGGDVFGESLAVIGDHLFASAPRDDYFNVDAGAVHMFNRHTGALIRTITGPTRQGAQEFGSSLAVHGNDLLIGAQGTYDISWRPRGAAYQVDGATGDVKHIFRLPSEFDVESTSYSVGSFVGSVDEDVLLTYNGDGDDEPRNFAVRLGGYDPRTRTIAYTSFSEPAIGATAYEGESGQELGFASTGVPVAGANPLAGVATASFAFAGKSLRHRNWLGQTTFDVVDLAGWEDAEVALWFRVGDQPYEPTDQVQLYITNGTEQVDLLIAEATNDTSDLIDRYGDYGAYTEIVAKIPANWTHVQLVLESSTSDIAGREYFEIDEVRVSGVYVVPEPPAGDLALILAGCLALLFGFRRTS